MLDLACVGTFVAVVESRSVSAAARRLRLSQSGVSQQLARLETALGASLVQRGRKACVPTAQGLAFLPFARAQENVVMVNIDYFAESHRIRGANDARKAIADGRVEIHTDYGFEFMFAIPAGRQQRTREIATRKEILLEMGLVPRPYTGGGCIINPAADAYELAYQAVVDAHLKRRFGPDYLASIESEVQRRLRKGKKAPNPAGTSPIVRPASVARPHGGEAA